MKCLKYLPKLDAAFTPLDNIELVTDSLFVNGKEFNLLHLRDLTFYFN